MGFECSFIKLPRLAYASPLEALTGFRYAQYKNWLDTDWCKQQIADGYNFTFDSYDPEFTGVELPRETILLEYVNFCNMNPDFDPYIKYWCSAGRVFDHIACKYFAPILPNGTTRTCTVKNIEDIQNELHDWFSSNKLVSINPMLCYQKCENNVYTVQTVDQMLVEFDDGSQKLLRFDDENAESPKLFMLQSDAGIEEYEIMKDFQKTLIDIALDKTDSFYFYSSGY